VFLISFLASQSSVDSHKQLLILGATAEAESLFASAHARFPFARYFIGNNEIDAAVSSPDQAIGALAQE
jgi:hypothetical protein